MNFLCAIYAFIYPTDIDKKVWLPYDKKKFTFYDFFMLDIHFYVRRFLLSMIGS